MASARRIVVVEPTDAADGVGKAAQIIGGRAKLAAALTNAPIDSIVNIHRPVPYRLGRVGDAQDRIQPMSENEKTYQIAKSGGRHSGVYERFKEARLHEIEKSIRSYRSRIDDHAEKIINPYKFVDAGISERHLNDLVARYWPREIEDFKMKIAIMEGIIQERTK